MAARSLVLTVLAFVVPCGPSCAQEARSHAKECTIAALPQSLFFVMEPAQPKPAGKKGGLVVVLPGGDGTREFLPWVENALLAQRPDDCTGVMIAAVEWQDDQYTTWPTADSKVPGMKYTTDEYVRAVVAEVEKTHAIDPARRVVVAWSSSGPAVYPLLVAKDSPFARGYVAMAVWPADIGDLGAAKGRRFVLDQSPSDQTTPFFHVRSAFAALTKAGAVVRLSTYEGGHGWNDEPLPRFGEGLRWLLGDEPAPKPVWPEPKKASTKGALVNLLQNGGFEDGLSAWQVIDNSKKVKVAATKDEHKEGKQSLLLEKKGGGPLDCVTQVVELPEGSTIVAKAMVKTKGAKNAWIKVWIYGQDNKPIGTEPELVHLTADGGWQQFEKSWPAKGAVRAVVQILLVADGKVWVDDVVLAVTK